MAMFMNRRRFLELTSAAVPLGFFSHHARAQATGEKSTYTYKSVDELKIQADVYSSKADRLRPTLIWIHGGALIMGDRRGIDDTFRDELVAAGFAVVSIDYRLAPETKLAAILEDVQDACKWVHDKGPKLFHADQSVRPLLSDPKRDGAVSPDAADSRRQGHGRSSRAIRRHGPGADEPSRRARADHGPRSRPRSS
jgi:alpha/beta hydrolase fold